MVFGVGEGEEVVADVVEAFFYPGVLGGVAPVVFGGGGDDGGGLVVAVL